MERGVIEWPANTEETLEFMSRLTGFQQYYFLLYDKEESLYSNGKRKHKVYNIRVMDEWGMVHEFYDQKARRDYWYHERGIKPVAFIVKARRNLDNYGIRLQQTNKSIKRYEKLWSWKEPIWHLPDHDFYFTKE